MAKAKPAAISEAKVRKSPRAAKDNATMRGDPAPRPKFPVRYPLDAEARAQLIRDEISPFWHIQPSERITSVTEEHIEACCDALRCGVSLRKACETLETLPARRTINLALQNRPDWAARLARAREIGAFALTEDALDIADGATEEKVRTARLRAEMRWKMAASHNQAAFGDRKLVQTSVDMQVNHAFTGLTRQQRQVLTGLLNAVEADEPKVIEHDDSA